jgi:ABC-type multidrug transport system fused ATPase/permease subunit
MPELSAPNVPSAERDLQRAALRALVELSERCAAREIEIEHQHVSAIEGADKELERTNWGIEERFKNQQDAIRQKYEGRTGSAENQYQTNFSALKHSDSLGRQRLDHEKSSIDREVKKSFEQAAWLAESVFDAAQIGLREEFKKVNDRSADELKTLDEMEQTADGLMLLYRQKPPPDEELRDTAQQAEGERAEAFYNSQRDIAQSGINRLQRLKAPKLFVGGQPYVAVIIVIVIAIVVGHWLKNTMTPDPPLIAWSAAIGLIAALILGFLLRLLANSQVGKTFIPLRRALRAARAAAQKELSDAKRKHDEEYVGSKLRRDNEIKSAKEKSVPILLRAAKTRETGLAMLTTEYETKLAAFEAERTRAKSAAESSQSRAMLETEKRRQRELDGSRERHENQIAAAKQKHAEAWQALERIWQEGMASAAAPIGQDNGQHAPAVLDWTDPRWANWQPPSKFTDRIRFGELQVDLKRITDKVPAKLQLPESFSVPAVLSFPRHASLLIHTDQKGRPESIRTLQMMMARLLTQLPAGRVRFTIIDPVSLGQNFAGFMHLADHDEALVGTRIWTDSEHINQRLSDLTEHMETVIQKYLRNEFETIDDYNAQAGELAEPYRFLVIADLPVGFEGDAFRRLASIASTGARCGVYTLVVRDTRTPLPSGAHLDELESHSLNLVRQNDKFVWKDDVFKQFPLALDPPPAEDFLTKILDVVGIRAKENKRVEVNFDTIAPQLQQYWTRSSTDDLQVPIGRLGATRLQMLKLGRGVAQHVLIAGKTGSGKSTLLHALVTNLAMWYHPDEVEFYLIDFKKGVEFKTYATHNLPHARAIAVESDREFGLSVLQRLDAELTKRGNLFRKLGIQDLPSYRALMKENAPHIPSPGTPGEGQGEGPQHSALSTPHSLPPLPRTLLIIDEFQEFFSEDDKLAQDAGLLLDRLVRQGRAFGIHVLLGSQTIAGSSGLARSTIGQMAVRIALQTSEADSHLILGDNNSAARLLSRPGEAIYNDAGGLVEGNSPFQIAWLPDDRREIYLARVRTRADALPNHHQPAIVFEGNAPADILKNQKLAALIGSPAWPPPPTASLAWLGEPVAIKDPTAVAFRRQSGANVLIVGQQEEAAMAMMEMSMISLAAQHPPKSARFYIMDGTPADSPLAGRLPRIKEVLPHDVNVVEWRLVNEALAELHEEMTRRQGQDLNDVQSIYLMIYGLQRYRLLRKQEESFSFAGGDEEKTTPPDKQFADLLREGPPLGIHVLAWTDTPASLERTLDRNSMREFDNRILFQMSANDSSNLIDSPMANKLGVHRALAYSEEQGIMEKFRPYALPDKNWLNDVAARLKARTI